MSDSTKLILKKLDELDKKITHQQRETQELSETSTKMYGRLMSFENELSGLSLDSMANHSETKESLDFVRGYTEKTFNKIDAFVKRLEDLEHENTAQDAALERLETQVEQLGK